VSAARSRSMMRRHEIELIEIKAKGRRRVVTAARAKPALYENYAQ